jgi:hypothetical protein
MPASPDDPIGSALKSSFNKGTYMIFLCFKLLVTAAVSVTDKLSYRYLLIQSFYMIRGVWLQNSNFFRSFYHLDFASPKMVKSCFLGSK